jgi:hypothetical protein
MNAMTRRICLVLCALALGACGRLEHVPTGSDAALASSGAQQQSTGTPLPGPAGASTTPTADAGGQGGATIEVTNDEGTPVVNLSGTEAGGAHIEVTNDEGTPIVRVDAPAPAETEGSTTEETADALIIHASDAVISDDCAGKRVEVRGSRNSIILTGDCPILQVSGNENAITISSVASIVITGDTNAVSWTQGLGGQDPTISDTGTMNVISQE